jgi:hypothetical protein
MLFYSFHLRASGPSKTVCSSSGLATGVLSFINLYSWAFQPAVPFFISEFASPAISYSILVFWKSVVFQLLGCALRSTRISFGVAYPKHQQGILIDAQFSSFHTLPFAFSYSIQEL